MRGVTSFLRCLRTIILALASLLGLLCAGALVLAQFGCAYRCWVSYVALGAGVLLALALITYFPAKAFLPRTDKSMRGNILRCVGLSVPLALVAGFLLAFFLMFYWTTDEVQVTRHNGQPVVIESYSQWFRATEYRLYEYRTFLWKGPLIEGAAWYGL